MQFSLKKLHATNHFLTHYLGIDRIPQYPELMWNLPDEYISHRMVLVAMDTNPWYNSKGISENSGLFTLSKTRRVVKTARNV